MSIEEDENVELGLLADEIAAWQAAGFPRHQARFHGTPEDSADKGGMFFCSGCRMIQVMPRLAELVSRLDDLTPQRQLGNKSQAEVTLEKLRERREVEGVTVERQR